MHQYRSVPFQPFLRAFAELPVVISREIIIDTRGHRRWQKAFEADNTDPIQPVSDRGYKRPDRRCAARWSTCLCRIKFQFNGFTIHRRW